MTGDAVWTRRARHRAFVAAAVTVIALIVAVVAAVGAYRSRPVPDDGQRNAVLAAADSAVSALMTFAPADAPARRASVAARLTGRMAVEYRSEGPDVVLPDAVESGLSMTARVVGVGMNTYAADQAQVLAFVDQSVSLPGMPAPKVPNSGTTPIARWATMRMVGGHWRLADLEIVGDATR